MTKIKAPESVAIGIRLPGSTIERADAIAASGSRMGIRGWSRNAVIVAAIEHGMKILESKHKDAPTEAQ